VNFGFWQKGMGILDWVEEISTEQLPEEFSLSQNYPNPFNPTTVIEFTVPSLSHISLVVYNLLGQEVTTLIDQPMSIGWYRASWDGLDENGHPVASGVYFYRMEADNFVKTMKMVLLK
jgi:hypothetical protein